MPAGAARMKAGSERYARPTASAPASRATTQRFGHLQPDELRARRADRAAHREIPLPSFRAHDEQIRDVRAGDEQHDADCGEQDPEGPRDPPEQLVSSGPHDGAMLADDARVAGGPAESLRQPAGEPVELIGDRLRRGAGRHSRDERRAELAGHEALGADVVRDPEHRAVRREPELGPHHAHDGAHVAGDVIGPVEHARIAAEP